MITRDVGTFVGFAKNCAPDFGPSCAKAVFLIAPEGFALAEQSASDNRYMDMGLTTDAAKALAEHRGLQSALSAIVPTICFSGRADTPDAQFPNNVFATAPGRLLLGHMRHAVRQREAERPDIRGFFAQALGYREIDLRDQPGLCELTGALVIDRARGLGFCGLSERCDEAGAKAMHAAFGLRATLMFDLAPGEYHTNVVLSVLAGRAVVIAPDGFADPAVVEGIAECYAPQVVRLGRDEKLGFAGNCIAVAEKAVFMSEAAACALRAENRRTLQDAGFALHAVPLAEIEKAGGSLRCCVAEIY
ncbi:arginine deiminase-related protein [Arenimonas sp.]|uniref:arginine deiminase-related protein n=1 Tax=Arenimonas sp. TaxID=1872635 RepID=UPI0039E396F0